MKVRAFIIAAELKIQVDVVENLVSGHWRMLVWRLDQKASE
jgi:hypothetical protein